MDMLALSHDARPDAALAQQTTIDNQRMATLLRRFRRFAHHTSILNGRAQQFADVLGELRDELAFHFALEEARQVLSEAVTHEPRLADTADGLRRQHVSLYREICRLADIAELFARRRRAVSSRRARALLVRCEEFDDRLNDHEAKEANLVYESLNVDIGVGD